jgi:Domain of unknown function (DUF4208)
MIGQSVDGRSGHQGRASSGQEATSESLFDSLVSSTNFYLQKQLKLSGGDMPRDDKVAILKESLAAIGRRIEIVLDTKQAAGEDRDRWRKHLWTCVNDATSRISNIF